MISHSACAQTHSVSSFVIHLFRFHSYILSLPSLVTMALNGKKRQKGADKAGNLVSHLEREFCLTLPAWLQRKRCVTVLTNLKVPSAATWQLQSDLHIRIKSGTGILIVNVRLCLIQVRGFVTDNPNPAILPPKAPIITGHTPIT